MQTMPTRETHEDKVACKGPANEDSGTKDRSNMDGQDRKRRFGHGVHWKRATAFVVSLAMVSQMLNLNVAPKLAFADQPSADVASVEANEVSPAAIEQQDEAQSGVEPQDDTTTSEQATQGEEVSDAAEAVVDEQEAEVPAEDEVAPSEDLAPQGDEGTSGTEESTFDEQVSDPEAQDVADGTLAEAQSEEVSSAGDEAYVDGQGEFVALGDEESLSDDLSQEVVSQDQEVAPGEDDETSGDAWVLDDQEGGDELPADEQGDEDTPMPADGADEYQSADEASSADPVDQGVGSDAVDDDASDTDSDTDAADADQIDPDKTNDAVTDTPDQDGTSATDASDIDQADAPSVTSGDDSQKADSPKDAESKGDKASSTADPTTAADPASSKKDDKDSAAKATEDAKGDKEAPATEDKSDAEKEDKDDKEEEKKEDATPMPPFAAEASAAGVRVRVTADEGVFPEGSTLSVRQVTNPSELAEVDSAVSEKRDAAAHVATSYVLDIKVLNKQGQEVEPAEGKKVKVSFATDEVANENLSTSVYHLEETNPAPKSDTPAPVEDLVANEVDLSISGAVATAETEGFSYYTVEFTYGDFQYVLEGDSSVPLSVIQEQVGLRGEASEVVTSNPELVAVERDEAGTWQVKARQAFTTTEWMDVTIGGIAYRVTLTDEIKIVTQDVSQSESSSYVRYKVSNNGFNVVGLKNGSEVRTTFSDAGYRTAIQVGSGAKTQLTSFAYGKVYSVDGVDVSVTASIPGGSAGKSVVIYYELTNTTEEIKSVKIGSSADTQIGSNDSAPVSNYNSTGIKMDEGNNGNIFYLLPGSGDFTTRWMGHYSNAYDNMYNTGLTTYSGDSGVAWSWTVQLYPGDTIVKSAVMAAGAASTLQTHNITFYGNGSTSGTMTSQTVFHGDGATLAPNNFKKSGYRFIGWATSSGGDVVYQNRGTLTNVTANISLYAKWEAKPENVLTADDMTIAYGDTTSIAASVLGGRMEYSVTSGDDVISVGQWTGNITTKKVGTATVHISVAESDDYYGAQKDITVTVTKRPLKLLVDAKTKTYGSADPTFTFSVDPTTTLISGDSLSSVARVDMSRVSGEDVGTYQISGTGTLLSDNYNLISVTPANLTIEPLTVALTWSYPTTRYNGQVQVPTVTVTNLKSGDSCDVTITTDVENPKEAGTYTVTAAALSNPNYALPLANQHNYAITQIPIVVSAENKTSTYLDEIEPLTYVEPSELVAGDELGVTFTLNGPTGQPLTSTDHVGDYSIIPTVTNERALRNYYITYVNGTYTLTKKSITATATGFTGTYDTDSHGIAATVAQPSDQGSEQAQVFYSTHDFATMDGVDLHALDADTTGTVAASLRELFTTGDLKDLVSTTSPTATIVDESPLMVYYLVLSDNYHVQRGQDRVIINKATLTAKANDKTITYGDAPSNDGVTWSGFVGGETSATVNFPNRLDYSYTYQRYHDVGTYAIIPRSAVTSNYNIVFEPGVLTVVPRTASIMWTGNSYVYDAADQGPDAIVETINDDEVAAVGLADGTVDRATDVGTYTTTYTALEGEKAHNYVLDTSTATHNWEIRAVSNRISSVTIDDWEYGEDATTPECYALWGGDAVRYEWSSTPNSGFVPYDETDPDKVPKDAGRYYLRAVVDASENYAGATSQPTPFEIHPADIIITARDYSYQYESGLTRSFLENEAGISSPAQPGTYHVEGEYLDGDDLGVRLSLEQPISGIYSVGSYNIVVGWNNNRNYTARLVNGQYHITPAGIDLEVVAFEGTYDGQGHGITINMDPANAGTIYYATEPIDRTNYQDKGSLEPITYKDAGEYTVYWYMAPAGDPAGGVAGSKEIDILPRLLHVTANPVTVAYGDDFPAGLEVTYSGNEGDEHSGFAPGEDAESADFDPADLVFEPDASFSVGSDVGTYAIEPSGLISNNYKIEYRLGVLEVAKRVVTPTWGSETEFLYNGNEQAPVITVTNALDGDEDDIAFELEGAPHVNVGDYTAKIIGLMGAKAHNYEISSEAVLEEDWSIVKGVNQILSVTPTNWVYGHEPALTDPIVDAIHGETTATFSYSDSESGPFSDTLPTDAGTWYVKATIPGTPAYDEVSQVESFTISKAPLTLESDDATVEYKINITSDEIVAELPPVAVIGLVNGDTAESLGITQTVGEGPYLQRGVYDLTPVIDTTKPHAKNYEVENIITGKVTMTQLDLHVDATGYIGQYDGNRHTISVVVQNNDENPCEVYYSREPLDKDNYSTKGTRDPEDESVSVLSPKEILIYYYVKPISDPEGGSAGSKKVRVTKAPLVVATYDQHITYGEEANSHAESGKDGLEYTIPDGHMRDDLNVDNLVYEYTYTKGDPVGEYQVRPTGVTSDFYELVFVPGILTVGRMPVTVTWPEHTWIAYTGDEVTMEVESLNGVLEGDDVYVSSYAGNTGTQVGSYVAFATAIGGTKASNYQLIPSFTLWEITQQDNNEWLEDPAIGIDLYDDEGTPVGKGWVYGHVPEWPTSKAKYGDLTTVYYYRPQVGDGEEPLPWTTDIPSEAGDYEMYAEVAETPNYLGLTSEGNPVPFTIQKALVVVGPEDNVSFYGEDLESLRYHIDGGLVYGDEIAATLSTEATSTSPVGEYPIIVDSADDNPNYLINTDKVGTYRIMKSELTVESEGYEGVYDTKPHGITVTHGETLREDDATIWYSNEELTLDSFADAEKTTDPMDASVTLTNVGELKVYFYVETTNYQAVPVYGEETIKITPAPLTVTAKANEIVFGDVPSNSGVEYDGFVGEGDGKETPEVLSGELSYAYGYERFGDVGTYAITPSGLTSDNYEITFVDGELTVVPREITRDMLTVDPDEFEYDGKEKKPTVSLVLTLEGADPYDLVAVRDFEVTGDITNTEVGTYQLQVAGTGNFTGTLDQSWRIFSPAEEQIGEDVIIDGVTYKVLVDASGNAIELADKPENLTVELAQELADPLMDEETKERAQQEGLTVKLYLVITRLDKDEVPEGDKDVLAAEAEKLSATEGMDFDVTLWLKIGDQPAQRIEATKSPITISLKIPEEFENKDEMVVREFGVVRAHEGEGACVSVPELKVLGKDEPVTFATDKFSSYALVYKDTQLYSVDVSAKPAMGGGVTADKASAAAGETVTLTATPAEGYLFTSWTVGEGNVNLKDPFALETTFTMPEGEVSVTANFEPIPAYKVTVSAVPAEGGTATADKQNAVPGDTVSLTATPAEGYRFAGWTVISGNATLADEFQATTTMTLTEPADDVIVVASFERIEEPTPDPTYSVAVFAIPAVGGTVSADKASAAAGETVTLTATPAEGYLFTSWTVNSGNVELTDPFSTTTTFTMPEGTVLVSANFEPIPTYTVTVSVDPAEGGTATADKAKAATGEIVTLTATPADGYSFVGWTVTSGNATLADASLATTTMTLTEPAGDVTVLASFVKDEEPTPSPDTYSVTISANPAVGGTVTVDKTSAAAGDTVTLTATPAEGYTFGSWDVRGPDGKPIEVTVKVDPATGVVTGTFAMPAGDVTVTANFERITSPQPEPTPAPTPEPTPTPTPTPKPTPTPTPSTPQQRPTSTSTSVPRTSVTQTRTTTTTSTAKTPNTSDLRLPVPALFVAAVVTLAFGIRRRFRSRRS